MAGDISSTSHNGLADLELEFLHGVVAHAPDDPPHELAPHVQIVSNFLGDLNGSFEHGLPSMLYADPNQASTKSLANEAPA
jgi:hypothetical protein